MIDFALLPTRLVSLHDLRWGDNGLNKDHLTDPYLRRDIDDLPLYVEQLVTGQHFFVHDGRHRAIRALARGEHEIKAHALMNSMRRALNEPPCEAQALLADSDETPRIEGTLLPLFHMWEGQGIPPNGFAFNAD